MDAKCVEQFLYPVPKYLRKETTEEKLDRISKQLERLNKLHEENIRRLYEKELANGK